MADYKAEPMSSFEYVTVNDGSLCPFCRSPNIEGQDSDFEGSDCYLKVVCSECSGEWEDVYTLTSYIDRRDLQ